MSPKFQIIILIVLLFLSGFFSSAETALTTVNKLKLRTMADEGSRRAARVLKITEDSGKLLSAILIGNNIVNIFASSLTTVLCTKVFGSRFIGLATGILTLLILIFGEITPKTLAAKNAVPMSMFFAYPIWILMTILTPVIWILDRITGAIFKLLGADKNEPEKMTESELLTVVDVSHEDGVIEPDAHFMISNVVDFGDALSKDIMIPRADVVFADVYSSYDELVELFKEETYSRIPIYEDSKDHVLGVLYLKDLFFYRETNDINYFDLRSILREPLFVFEYQKTSQIFADMKAASCSIAIVLDEYGVCSGIITMEDLIEEIVGEIRDEYDADEEDFIRQISENMYDIDASMKLDDVNDALETNFHSEDYDSIGGFVIELLDKLPSVNEEAMYENAIFKVMQVKKNRIERVLLTLLPKEDDTAESESENEA